MNDLTIQEREPVTAAAAVDAALIATVNVLAVIFGWDGTIVAGLNLAIGAWVVAFSVLFTRKRAVSVKALNAYAAAVAKPEFP
jgi:membrane associated rhomboid family serine protease